MSSPTTPVVFWDALQRCRGINLTWKLLGDTWIPGRVASWIKPLPVVVETLVLQDWMAESLSFAPDPPAP